MARHYKIDTDFGFVRAIAFKSAGFTMHRVDVSCVNVDGKSTYIDGAGDNAGEVWGSNGHYTTAGGNVSYRQFSKLTDAIAYIVECWLEGKGAGYAPATPDNIAIPVAPQSVLIGSTYYGRCPGCDEVISGTALCKGGCHDCECKTCGRGKLACECRVYRPWRTPAAPTASDAHALADTVLTQYLNTDDEAEAAGLVQRFLDAAGAWHFLSVAEGMRALPAVCESGRHAHCAACGDPVTYTLPGLNGYRVPANGSHIVKMGGYGPIRRYCAKCVNFARWLALPEGGDQVRVIGTHEGMPVIDGNSYFLPDGAWGDLPDPEGLRIGSLTITF